MEAMATTTADVREPAHIADYEGFVVDQNRRRAGFGLPINFERKPALLGELRGHYKSFVVGLGFGLLCVRAALWPVLSAAGTRDAPKAGGTKALFSSSQEPPEIANDDDLVNRLGGRWRRLTLFKIFEMAGEIAQKFYLSGIRPVDDSQQGVDGTPLVSFGQPLGRGLCQTAVFLFTLGVHRQTIKGRQQDCGEQRSNVVGHFGDRLELLSQRSLSIYLCLKRDEPALVNRDLLKRLLKPCRNFCIHRASASGCSLFDSQLQFRLQPQSKGWNARCLRATDLFFRHSYMMQQKMLANMTT